MEETDGTSGRGNGGDLYFRLVTYVALALGVGSGGYTLSTADERASRAEMEAALNVRDVEIRHLHEQYKDLKRRLDSLGLEAGDHRDFERRISRIEDRLD